MGNTIDLTLREVTVRYDDMVALNAITWSAPSRGLVAVIGPNGAGKSTLIKAILGLVPSSGTVLLNGATVASRRELTGYVPQRASVDWTFPATALDVVLQGMVQQLGLFRGYGRARRQRAMDLLARVGLADLADRQIGAMSGGQQQRVFLARGLARDARLLCLDEPLAGVDAASEAVILDVMDGIRDEGRLVLCVHHDLATVARRFDHVLVLNRSVVASGTVAEAFTGETLAQAYGVPLSTLPRS